MSFSPKSLGTSHVIILYISPPPFPACGYLCTPTSRWAITALVAFLLLICALLATIVLAVYPHISSFTYHFAIGGTFVIPLQPSSFWFHSVTLQTNSDDLASCTGGAVVVPCAELKPKFIWYNSSENTRYLTEGSKILFLFDSSSRSNNQCPLWVFTNYARYKSATESPNFAGLSCTNPHHGDWCREIGKGTPTLTHNITQRGYYYVACQKECSSSCPLVFHWYFLQGYYDIEDYTNNWSYYSVDFSDPNPIIIQELFHFNSPELCLLVSMPSNQQHILCQPGYKYYFVVDNIVKRPDLLLFPLLVAALSFFLLIISLPCCSYHLWRRKKRRVVVIDVTGNTHELVNHLH